MKAPNFWKKPSLISYLLSPISFIYCLLSNFRYSSIKPTKIKKPLIDNYKFLKKLDNKNKFIKFTKKIDSYKIKKVNELKEKILNRNKVVIFCAGAYSDIIIKICKKLSIKIHVIIDNNLNYNDQKLSNIAIKHPSMINLTFFKENQFLILVCNKNINDYKKIRLQLINMRVKKKYIVHLNI